LSAKRPPLRDLLACGPIAGTFVSIGHPAAVEALAWAGWELVCIDAEHAALGPSEVEALIRAADACDVRALVRVAAIEPDIARALDSGAAGVVVPRVETSAEAQRCVAAARYPPLGTRGAGPGRASRYGAELADRLISANQETLLVVQIETVLGSANAAAIAAVDGIDVIFVGPGDLSVSLRAEQGSAEHTATVSAILAAAADAGRASGIFCAEPEQTAVWRGLGTRFFLIGGDLARLMGAAASAARRTRVELGTVPGD
jgi:4-hydroxy-2-oxoheptanedioate aldolase